MNSPRLSLRGVHARRLQTMAETDSEEAGDDDHGHRDHHHDDDAMRLVLSVRDALPSFASSTGAADYTQAELTEACLHFAIVGVGYLFPFSALTQPVDYWQLLFPDFNIEFPLTTIYMYTNLAMLTFLVFLGGTPKFTQRIVGGFLGQLIVLVFVPTSYFLALEEHRNAVAILSATATAAVVTAFIDSSVIALASQYPLRVQEWFQFGVGLSTLIGSIYRDATKILFPPEMVVESSLLYFYSGAATIAVCIASYYRLMQLDMSKKCLARAIQAEEARHHQQPHHHSQQPEKAFRSKTEADTGAAISTEKSPLLAEKVKNATEDDDEPDKWVVLQKIFFNESMVLLLFMSTLALWPPLVTEIPSFNFPGLEATGWWSLILLTVFSVSDCTGRLLVRYRSGITKDNIWIAVLARFLLFPLIICSVKGAVFTHDLFSVLFVGALGATNGYVGTLCIVLVNEACSEDEQAVAGTFTGFFLNAGLVFGATIGLVSDKLV